MRERDINRKMFHRGHWEVIAARFRHELDYKYATYANYGTFEIEVQRAQRNALIDLAIALGQRFALDNEEFDPLVWLDRCSPDPENYPLSELWPGVDQTAEVDA